MVRVLVVEDNASESERICEFLRQRYNVAPMSVEGPQHAIHEISRSVDQRSPYAWLWIDYDLQSLAGSGRDVARETQRLHESANLPLPVLLLVSGNLDNWPLAVDICRGFPRNVQQPKLACLDETLREVGEAIDKLLQEPIPAPERPRFKFQLTSDQRVVAVVWNGEKERLLRTTNGHRILRVLLQNAGRDDIPAARLYQLACGTCPVPDECSPGNGCGSSPEDRRENLRQLTTLAGELWKKAGKMLDKAASPPERFRNLGRANAWFSRRRRDLRRKQDSLRKELKGAAPPESPRIAKQADECDAALELLEQSKQFRPSVTANGLAADNIRHHIARALAGLRKAGLERLCAHLNKHGVLSRGRRWNYDPRNDAEMRGVEIEWIT